MSTNDRVLKLPWSVGHEIVCENADEKGKEVRAMNTEEVLELVDRFFEAAWRLQWVPGGREIEESKQVALAFGQVGVAALDLSMCVQESPGSGFDPMQCPEGWTMYTSEAIKQVVNIPVINSHSLRNPEFCEKVLAEGKTDVVGFCRQVLADPYLPLKVKLGKPEKIRRCISCLTGCWQESLMAKKDMACAINPACNDLRFANMKKSSRPVRIAIIGGGPAGMEAARISTIRGHKPTIFEKTGDRWRCSKPSKSESRRQGGGTFRSYS